MEENSTISYRIRAPIVGAMVVVGTPIDMEPMTGAAIVVIGTEAPYAVAGKAAEIDPTIGAPIIGAPIVVIGAAPYTDGAKVSTTGEPIIGAAMVVIGAAPYTDGAKVSTTGAPIIGAAMVVIGAAPYTDGAKV